MKTARMLGWAAALGLAVIVATPPLAIAEGQPPARTLARTIERKNAVRVQRSALEKEHADVLAALDADIDDARQEVERLERRLDRAKRGRTTPDALPSAPETDEEDLVDWIAEQRDEALEIARRLQTRITTGLPIDRRARLAEARRIAEQLGDADPSVQLEGIGNLWTLLTNESRLGRSVELSNEPVELGSDRRIDAYVMRVGRVLLLFAEEGGSEAGAATPEGWTTDLSPEQRAEVVAAVDVLRRRQPPRLAPLPAWVDPSSEETAP